METDFYSGPLGQLVTQFSAFFPRLIGALSVLLLGWIVSRTIGKVLSKLLASAGVDRLADMFSDIEFIQRAGMVRARVSNLLAKGVYYTLMLIFIIAATEVMGVSAITQLFVDLMNYLPFLLTAGAILLTGIFLADMARGGVLTFCQSLGIPSAKMIASIVFYFVFVTVGVSALAQAKINTSFISANLTAIVAAVALAFSFGYGLASRDLISNYLASYYNKNKVRIGDDVRIIGERGRVVVIDNTSLILQTSDRAIIIPLSKLTVEKVEVFYPEPREKDLLEAGDDEGDA